MLHWLGVALALGIAGVALAFCVMFVSSLLFFSIRYWRGTLIYFGKTVLMGAMIVPIAGLAVVCAAPALVLWFAVWVKGRLWNLRGRSGSHSNQHEEPDGKHDIVVHLVHGTFEQDAAWTHAGSPMRDEILRQNPSVKFKRFVWSGLNTQRGRREAAEKLARRLEESASNHHYVVAHSHGGNIVRELSHIAPHVATKLRGVNLLSPPFIFRRKITRAGRNFVYLHTFGFALVAQLIFAAMLVPVGWYGLPVFGLTSLVVVLIEVSLSKKFGAQLDKELAQEGPDVDLRDVQILHAIGDEADSILRFVSLLNETCFGIFSQLEATRQKAKSTRPIPYLISLALLTGAAALAWRYTGDEKRYWIGAVGAAFLMVLFAFVKDLRRPSREEQGVLLMAALPVAVLSVWLGAAKSLAYGDWRLLFLPEIFVFSSETPEGSHSILKYAPSTDGALIHSTHAHPDAIRDVASWLHYSLSEKRTASPATCECGRPIT